MFLESEHYKFEIFSPTMVGKNFGKKLSFGKDSPKFLDRDKPVKGL